MVAMLGFISTDVTPSSLRALRACEPSQSQTELAQSTSDVSDVLWVLYEGRHYLVGGRVLTGVVEFSSLSNAESSTTNYKHFFHINQLWFAG